MTIPGKGGRPRKWRSDADRVRAFRARERGEDEPQTMEQALDDGDELATVRQLTFDLAGQLAESERARSQLLDELAAERRRREAADRRVSRLREEVVRLTGAVGIAERALAERDAIAPERSAIGHDQPTPATPNLRSSETPERLNRAQRRRADREGRRRSQY